MSDRGRPSTTALVTSACFTGGNLAVLVGGGILGLLALKIWWLLMFVVWGATGAAYALKVVMTANDPRFIAQVAREDATLLPPAPSGKVLELMGGAGLSGKYLEDFSKVKQLKDELVATIKQLPEGPGKDAFLEYVPTLDEVTPEVHRLASQVQKLEKELGSADVRSLEKEISDLEARVGAASDPEAKGQLETALDRKRKARDHYASAREGIPRTQAQIEAIVSSMQEARARVTALQGRLADPAAGLSQAQEAVQGISREVKYLTQTVEETVKLLN